MYANIKKFSITMVSKITRTVSKEMFGQVASIYLSDRIELEDYVLMISPILYHSGSDSINEIFVREYISN